MAHKDDAASSGAVGPQEANSGEPRRIQLSRAKGWRMPPNTVKVDRSTKWGNHIVVGTERGIGHRAWTAADAVAQFRIDMEDAVRSDRPDGSEPLDLTPLRGKNLACWCRPGDDCHADVLLELANSPDGEAVVPRPHPAGERASASEPPLPPMKEARP